MFRAQIKLSPVKQARPLSKAKMPIGGLCLGSDKRVARCARDASARSPEVSNAARPKSGTAAQRPTCRERNKAWSPATWSRCSMGTPGEFERAKGIEVPLLLVRQGFRHQLTPERIRRRMLLGRVDLEKDKTTRKLRMRAPDGKPSDMRHRARVDEKTDCQADRE